MVPLRPHLARFFGLLALSFVGAPTSLLTAAPAAAPGRAAVLNGWFAAQQSLRSWSAEFIQTRTLRTLARPLTAKGRLWFAPPDRFRWELGRPVRTLAIRRTNVLWLVYPRLKRVECYPLNGDPRSPWRSAVALIQAGFPRNRATFERGFVVESVTPSNAVYRIRFRPRSPAARQFLTGLSVELRTNDFTLRANTLTFVDGSELRNDYTNAVVNPPLDAALFTVSTNAGWEVVEPAAQP